MTYPEFVKEVAKRVHAPRWRIRRALAAAFDVLGEAAARGRVEVPDFGVFLPRTRKARAISNPITKERMHLPESRTVGFRAAKELRMKAATR